MAHTVPGRAVVALSSAYADVAGSVIGSVLLSADILTWAFVERLGCEGMEPVTQPTLPEALWREVLGEFLRAERLRQRRILTEVAGVAGVSPQYLSEIERGRKEPSSEILAAVAGALGLTLFDVTAGIAAQLAAVSTPAVVSDSVGVRGPAPVTGRAQLRLVA